jgi:hypothetical protein
MKGEQMGMIEVEAKQAAGSGDPAREPIPTGSAPPSFGMTRDIIGYALLLLEYDQIIL